MPAKKSAKKKAAPASTENADMSVVKPPRQSKTKAGKSGAKKPKGKVADKTAHMGTPGGRQKGAKTSTVFDAPGPESPTGKDGNYAMTPGVDIQARAPLAPTETRNTIAASSENEKPETNVPRHADENGMDVAAVPPAVVDEDNKKAFDALRKDAAKNDPMRNRRNDGSSKKPKA